MRNTGMILDFTEKVSASVSQFFPCSNLPDSDIHSKFYGFSFFLFLRIKCGKSGGQEFEKGKIVGNKGRPQMPLTGAQKRPLKEKKKKRDTFLSSPPLFGRIQFSKFPYFLIFLARHFFWSTGDFISTCPWPLCHQFSLPQRGLQKHPKCIVYVPPKRWLLAQNCLFKIQGRVFLAIRFFWLGFSSPSGVKKKHFWQETSFYIWRFFSFLPFPCWWLLYTFGRKIKKKELWPWSWRIFILELLALQIPKSEPDNNGFLFKKCVVIRLSNSTKSKMILCKKHQINQQINIQLIYKSSQEQTYI